MKILFTMILTLLIISGCSGSTEKNNNTNDTKISNEKVSEQQPIIKKDDGIVLTDTSGKNIKVKKLEDGFIFEGYENKIVLINFFATWCPPCKAEIPHLNNLQQKYNKDIKIISILLEENKSNDEVINFMNKNSIEFTITNSLQNFQLAKEVGGVQSIPFMLIYDKKGHYFQHYKGAVPEEMIEADIKKIL